jgi:hypothetical protein
VPGVVAPPLLVLPLGAAGGAPGAGDPEGKERRRPRIPNQLAPWPEERVVAMALATVRLRDGRDHLSAKRRLVG